MATRYALRPYAVAWNHKKSRENFLNLYHEEFEPHVNPVYRAWRIFKHTYVDGLYKFMEADERWYLKWRG